MIETFFVYDHVLVIVDTFADASHEGLVLGDAPEYKLVLQFVFLVMVVHANLWVR